MRRSRKFCQRRSKFDVFSLVDERGEYLVFGWCADDGPTLNAGLVAL